MAARYDVHAQRGRTINNVGGNQYVHLAQSRRRLAGAGKTLAIVCLWVSLAALVSLGLAAYETTQAVIAAVEDGSLAPPYAGYAPGYAVPALGALAAGIVLGKLGRILSL